MPVFIDFLTEHPTATTGTAMVDGVLAGVFPGVARALATRRKAFIINIIFPQRIKTGGIEDIDQRVPDSCLPSVGNGQRPGRIRAHKLN